MTKMALKRNDSGETKVPSCADDGCLRASRASLLHKGKTRAITISVSLTLCRLVFILPSDPPTIVPELGPLYDDLQILDSPVVVVAWTVGINSCEPACYRPSSLLALGILPHWPTTIDFLQFPGTSRHTAYNSRFARPTICVPKTSSTGKVNL